MFVLSKEFREILYRQQRLLLVTWLMFFIALGFYLMIPEITSEHLPPPADYPYTEQMRNTLWVVSIAATAFLLWVKSHFHTVQAIFRASRQPLEIRDLKGDTPIEKDAARLVFSYRSRMIIAFSLSEMIAIFGLVLALIGNYRSDQQVFSLISACLLVYFYPSRTFFDELIAECERREMTRT